ncbi:MAG: hypothetical protein VKJ24_15220 [Synechococcales bacterium]|nr:hypothetical protein [Synechococcales bacterium]
MPQRKSNNLTPTHAELPAPRDLVEIAFRRSRQPFKLGIGELQAALEAIAMTSLCGGVEEVEGVLRLLWCHSRRDWDIFAGIWREVWAEATQMKPDRVSHSQDEAQDVSEREDPSQSSSAETPHRHEEISVVPIAPESNRFEALPVQAPPILEGEEGARRSDFPVTRRSLSYGWRSLRRLRADGVKDVVDVAATIQQAAQQGFYLAPVFRRREVNHARLLLLIDQQGSMVPFHRFSRDLVETAREDGTIEEVQVYYFHNVPREYVYEDEHLTQPIEWAQVLQGCDAETSVMIVSDAGAARGSRRLTRIRETTQFLVKLMSQTSLVGWLNPLPRSRWSRSAAEILAYSVRMETLDQDGFSTMVREVRGLPLEFGARGEQA